MTTSDIDGQSLGELVAAATGNVSKLVRSEIELAKIELKAEAIKAAIGSVMFIVAGLLGTMIVILWSIALAYGLVALGVWTWAAFLLVGALYLLTAAGCIWFGYRKMKKLSPPKRTIQTMQDNAKLFKRPSKS
ncbi:phage holin family protein [Actinocorallia longicatena]|uniref:Phage holin family protein n=1 Tax=Actinocorallia longicatena TaxID=111803 RepID=A0ABP6Q9T6_9ACTN